LLLTLQTRVLLAVAQCVLHRADQTPAAAAAVDVCCCPWCWVWACPVHPQLTSSSTDLALCLGAAWAAEHIVLRQGAGPVHSAELPWG
jgi:hypothetical protein